MSGVYRERSALCTEVSFYCLTYNSEKYLDAILSRVSRYIGELIIVDSGSNDSTLAIARKHGCTIYHRDFDDFTAQRRFAMAKCSRPWVFFLDSDELPSENLLQSIFNLEQTGWLGADGVQAYGVIRHWHVLGRRVHCLYPVKCPDVNIRLFQKEFARYTDSSMVHESMHGFAKSKVIVQGHVDHYTFESDEEFLRKQSEYSRLSAAEMYSRNFRPSPLVRRIMPLLVWFKWYFLTGAWKDGAVGWRTSYYAYQCSRLRHKFLEELWI